MSDLLRLLGRIRAPRAGSAAVQGLTFFSGIPLMDRRWARTREPVAAARLYLDRLVSAARGVRAAVVAEGGRVVAGAGAPTSDLARLAEAARDAEGGGEAALPGDLFVHQVQVRGRRHLFATLGGRARRVREVERDLVRILGA